MEGIKGLIAQLEEGRDSLLSAHIELDGIVLGFSEAVQEVLGEDDGSDLGMELESEVQDLADQIDELAERIKTVQAQLREAMQAAASAEAEA